MSPILLATLLSQLGTTGIPLIVKLVGDITAGRTQTSVTVDDLNELARLAALTSDEIYRRLGITPPPAAAPTAAPDAS